MSVYDTYMRRMLPAPQYGNSGDESFGSSYSDFGNIGAYQNAQVSGSTQNPQPEVPPQHQAQDPDPLDQQITDTRGTLARQRAELDNAIKSQFQTPYPQQVSPKFGWRDLLWLGPAVLAASGAIGGHNQGPGLAEGIISGALQGKNQDAQDTNSRNMGMFNYAMKQGAAGVDAAQSQIAGTQDDMHNLMQLKSMGITGQAAAMKGAVGMLTKLQGTIQSGGPEARVDAARQGRALALSMPGLPGAQGWMRSDDEIQSLGTLKPGEAYQNAGVGLRGAQQNAFQELANVRKETASFLADSKDVRLAKIGSEAIKNISYANSLDQLTPARVSHLAHQDKLSDATVLYREAMTAAVPQRTAAYVNKAMADVQHYGNMDSLALGKFTLDQAKSLNTSLHQGMSELRQQIGKLEGDKAYLESQLQFVQGDAKQKVQAHIDEIDNRLNGYTNGQGVPIPGLYNASSALSDQATGVRKSLGLNDDGTGKIKLPTQAQPQGQQGDPEKGMAQQAIDTVNESLKSGKISQHQANLAIEGIKQSYKGRTKKDW